MSKLFLDVSGFPRQCNDPDCDLQHEEDKDVVTVMHQNGKPYKRKMQPVYPKPYYQIMASKSVPTQTKKIALAQIREWHKEKSLLYNPNASYLTTLVAFSQTPQGYYFWIAINNAISKF